MAVELNWGRSSETTGQRINIGEVWNGDGLCAGDADESSHLIGNWREDPKRFVSTLGKKETCQ